MPIDWRGYQIPGYLAAQDTRAAAEQATTALGQMIGYGYQKAFPTLSKGSILERQDISGKTVTEGLMGQGRSYYRDNVDKSIYGSYGDWVESDESGRYLKLAEAGAQFTRDDKSGALKVRTPGDDDFESLGGVDPTVEDGAWNPYLGLEGLTGFESSMQETYMGPEWQGGDYTYRTPRSAIGALFRKERYRPVSNLYREQAMSGIEEQFEDPSAWAGLSETEPGGLGWYPGKVLSGKGPLMSFIGQNTPYKPGQQDDPVIDDPTNIDITDKNKTKINVNLDPDKKPSGQGTQQVDLTWDNTVFGSKSPYKIGNVHNQTQKQMAQKALEDAGITPAQFVKAYELAKARKKFFSASELFRMLTEFGYQIDPQTGAAVPKPQ